MLLKRFSLDWLAFDTGNVNILLLDGGLQDNLLKLAAEDGLGIKQHDLDYQ